MKAGAAIGYSGLALSFIGIVLYYATNIPTLLWVVVVVAGVSLFGLGRKLDSAERMRASRDDI